MRVQEVLNGVNLDRMDKLADEVKQNPDLAKFRFHVTNKWVEGSHCTSTISDFYGFGKEDDSRKKPFVLQADEPDVLLGGDLGPNATEALLHALASCLNTTLICQAASQGIEIRELTLDLEGDIDLRGFLDISDEINRAFENIRVKVRVNSDAPAEKLEDLCRLAKKNSPVYNILTNPVPVSIELKTD